MKVLTIFKLLLVMLLVQNTLQWGFKSFFKKIKKITKRVVSQCRKITRAIINVFDPHLRGKVTIDNQYCGECRMKPSQNEHGFQLYDCTNASHSKFNPFRHFGGIFFPHVQRVQSAHHITTFPRMRNTLESTYMQNGSNSYTRLKIDFFVLETTFWGKAIRAMETIKASTSTPYKSAKNTAINMCGAMNEGTRRIIEFDRQTKPTLTQQVTETNARIRELERLISDKEEKIEATRRKVIEAKSHLEIERQAVERMSNECVRCESSVKEMTKRKVRLIKINNEELTTDANHELMSLEEKSRCEFLKYQDGIETLVPSEKENTKCSLRETVENYNFEKTRKCVEDIKS